MLAHLMSWAGEAAHWEALIPIAALALIEAVLLPARLWAKGVWVLAVAAACVLAGAAVQRDDRATQAAVGSEIAGLKGLWAQWDAVSRTLPPAGEAPDASFDTVNDALASLSAKVAGIGGQITALKKQTTGRSISDDTAAKLVDYLRQYAGNRAVVSCVPDDLEAYTYANQLATVLHMAGWEARGPEITATSDEAAAMGVSLFVRDPRSPDAAKILIDAFTRFNVPYQTGLSGSDAIPDTATVELFVAKKP